MGCYSYTIKCVGYKTKDGYVAYSAGCGQEWKRQTNSEVVPGSVSHGICQPCAKLSLEVSIETIIAHQLKVLQEKSGRGGKETPS